MLGQKIFKSWNIWRTYADRNRKRIDIVIFVFVCAFMMLELRWIYDIFTVDSQLLDTQNCNGCFKSRLKELHNPKSMCTTGTQNIIIVVKSRATSVAKRNSIRQSWGSIAEMQSYNFKVIYVIGRGDVEDEIRTHGDIFQIDLDEDYLKVTYKITMAFHWVVEHCNNAKFFMNADDDTFVNIRLLWNTLNTYDLTNAVGGCCKSKRTPVRMPWGKNKQSFEQYPFRIYPKYCSGAGYIMGMKAAITIERLITDTPFSILDDMLIGVIVLKTDIEIFDIPGFHYKTWSFIANNYDQACSIVQHTDHQEEVKERWELSKTNPTHHCAYQSDTNLNEIGRYVMVHLYIVILSALLLFRLALVRKRNRFWF